MGRPRLTDAEREERRKARNAHTFSDAAYHHYDASEGWGGPEDWERVAEEVFRFLRPRKADTARDPWLASLGLLTMPGSLSELTQAFRKAMFKAHPDYGGSNADARTVLEAYAVLKRRFR